MATRLLTLPLHIYFGVLYFSCYKRVERNSYVFQELLIPFHSMFLLLKDKIRKKKLLTKVHYIKYNLDTHADSTISYLEVPNFFRESILKVPHKIRNMI